MTDFRCDACGRPLADDTAFCPYCGADRRAPSAEVASQPAPASPAPAVTTSPPALQSVPVTPPPAAAPAASRPHVDPAPPAASSPPRTPVRRGCATPLLLLLLAVLAAVSWCALHRPPAAGAPVVAGAIAAQPLRVSHRWRTVRLPGDAPASARFAVSSDTALRVRAGDQLYVVRPHHPLRLPEDIGSSFDVRAADYVSSQDAARAKAALITLGG